MHVGKVKPEGYRTRLVDDMIDEYMDIFGAVEIAGTKWAGKTWTARAHAASIVYIDQGSNREMAEADPSLVLDGARPHVIDEWQLVPKIWDYVRHAADETSGLRGAWILTGSSTPENAEEVSHSGAGRFGHIRMWPMSLQESGDSDGSVSLKGLFEGRFEGGPVQVETDDLLDLCCRGGWPGAHDLPVKGAMVVARSYYQDVVRRSIPKLRRNPETADRLLHSLARNLAQSATYETIQTDIAGGEADADAVISTKTVSEYIRIFKDMYLVDGIRGWAPPKRSPKRIMLKEKRYFADPSLAAAILGLSPSSLRADWQTFGLLFENLCMRDLQVYAQALGDVALEPVRYYRDDSGLEADAIIELDDGRWAAIEIKLSENKIQQGVDSLLALKKKLCENTKARTREPEFMAVIVGIASFAYRTPEGVFVIPITCLGA